jgi:hypothetical protein
MKLVPILVVGLIAIGWSPTIQAQSALSADANTAVKIVEARKANAALLRQYTWNSRTEIIVNGQVKDTRIELVQYGPGGNPQRTLLNDQGAPLPFGFLRRAIAESERQQMQQYLTDLRGLLDQYTLPTAGKVLDFLTQATIAGIDPSGLVQMTGRNVVVPGDTLSIWTDIRTQQTRRVQVNSSYRGNPVNMTGTFQTLFGGPNYMAFAEVTVPAKQLSVQVQNYDYIRTN